MTAKGRSQAGAGGRKAAPWGCLPLAWLGSHILGKDKSSYTSGLTSGSSLVPEFLFLTNRELKGLHFTPTPALHSDLSLSLYRHQQCRHMRIWGLGLFFKKIQLHINFTLFSAMVSSLNLFLRTFHFIVTCTHLYIHDLSYYKKSRRCQQIW